MGDKKKIKKSPTILYQKQLLATGYRTKIQHQLFLFQIELLMETYAWRWLLTWDNHNAYWLGEKCRDT